MPNFIKQLGSSIGFGLTRVEAEEDAYINSCIISLSNDTEQIFKQRREQLKPWMPTPVMVHISGVGCLSYEDGIIAETNSGNRVVVASTGTSIFYYLSELFGKHLSYTDIVCVLREEFDTFFQNISEDFITIQNMDIIQCQQETISFVPTTMYNTSCGFVIGCSDNAIGIKFQGEDSYYISQVEDVNEQIFALHRLMYRTGTSLREKYSEEQND